MLPSESRNPRPERRARRKTELTGLEALEERTLLSFTTLGYSLPDLTISGEAGTTAAWGGTLNVSAYLQNIGASSTTEPISQLPATEPQATGSLYNSTSSADAPASIVKVVLTRSPKSLRGAVTLGTIQADPLAQNSLEQLDTTFSLPSRPKGFAGSGTVYVRFVANATNAFEEVSFANNISQPVAVHLTKQAAPNVRVIGLSVPATMQPGDTIYPIATIENFGTADSGPITVDLVESLTRKLTLGKSVIASFEVDNIPAASAVATRGNSLTVAEQIITPGQNVFSGIFTPVGSTSTDGLVTLATTPRTYYLGVVVGPTGTSNDLGLPSSNYQAIHIVGPPSRFLPASGGVSTIDTSQFPTAPSGQPVGVL